MLDLCCGKGGASIGFNAEGYDCEGIDINNYGYPYHFIQADLTQIKGGYYQGFDVIWASPPCRDFTQLPDHHTTKKGIVQKWKQPKNPENGLVLINTCLNFIKEANPKFWILENVTGLVPYMKEKPQMITEIKRGMFRAFWGNFPLFLMPCDNKKRVWLWDDSANKAIIPKTCSSAFAKACKEKLLDYAIKNCSPVVNKQSENGEKTI